MPRIFLPSRGKVPVEIGLYGTDNMLKTEINAMGATASAAWPLANLAIFIPFWVEDNATATKMWWTNGGTASGSIDVGIYDENGTQLVSSGTVTQTGTSTMQVADITDTSLSRGYYYYAMACNNTTQTFNRYSPTVVFQTAVGCIEQTSAFNLPTPTATFAKNTRSFIPVVGIQFNRTLGI